MTIKVGQIWKHSNQTLTILAKTAGGDEYLAKYEYDGPCGDSGYGSYSAEEIKQHYTLQQPVEKRTVKQGQVWRISSIPQNPRNLIIKILTKAPSDYWWVLENEVGLPSKFMPLPEETILKCFDLID